MIFHQINLLHCRLHLIETADRNLGPCINLAFDTWCITMLYALFAYNVVGNLWRNLSNKKTALNITHTLTITSAGFRSDDEDTKAKWYNRGAIKTTLIAMFMGTTWGPSGADRTQVGPMLAPWKLRSGNSKYTLPSYQYVLNMNVTFLCSLWSNQ